MPRPKKALGLCALALAILTPSTSIDVVRAGARPTETRSRSVSSDRGAARCSTWSSTVIPPKTIRVYREAYGPARGTVQTVSFRKWAEHVLGTEMPGYYPLEALKANAISAKQFGWYYVLNWRGGHAPDGKCYDVRDTGDGFYRPEVYSPGASHLKAMAATWPISLRKRDNQTGRSRLFLTGYRAGAFVGCGEDSNGWHLMQHSAHACGRDGHTWEGIVRKYMEPNLEVVTPGRHNVVNSVYGDATAIANVGGQARPRIYRSTGSGFQSVPSTTVDIDPADTLGVVAADVTNDRRLDLVFLQETSNGAKLLVQRSNGDGYEAPRTFWSSTGDVARHAKRLIGGDFDGDGIADVGIVASAPNPAKVSLFVLRSVVTSFADPVKYWNGSLDLSRARVYGADPTGDGRTDLVMERDRGADGMDYLVAGSQLNGGALSKATLWYRDATLHRVTTRTAVGDLDRDGRDDMILAISHGGGTKVVGLKVDRRNPHKFLRSTFWTNKPEHQLPLANVKLSAVDVNSDGRADAILWVNAGERGTRLIRLRVNDRGTLMSATDWLFDRTLDWDATRPY